MKYRFVKVEKVEIEDAPEIIRIKAKELASFNPIILKGNDTFYILTPYYSDEKKAKRKHPH